MRLPLPFYRLPLRLDVARLQSEIASLPAAAWVKHPNQIEGNSSVRLISVEGAENDEVDGPMAETVHLRQMPYVRQVLAAMGVVWSRSRLMRLDPYASVPEHADINRHWFVRTRLHFPVQTRPEVLFHCGDQSVHMSAGEAWLFDNWRLHRVENPTDTTRIHLVADTSGSAAFWRYVFQSNASSPVADLVFDPRHARAPLAEVTRAPLIMTPEELELLLLDLRTELTSSHDAPELQQRLLGYHALLDGFSRDWRQLYALHGEQPEGWSHYERTRDSLRSASRNASQDLVMRTNRVPAHRVLEARVLQHLVPPPAAASPADQVGRRRIHATSRLRLDRPVFIVAAPRSGSTLLYETLAVTPQFYTLGGEAHWMVEDRPELVPGYPGVDSNRLTADRCTAIVAGAILDGLASQLRDANGQGVGSGTGPVRMLEKTPKNALRIPFFDQLFPDARFIFLWRDPRENIGSIMEAWRSGGWRTYASLEGWDGPWSLLLPPGWRSLRGQPLEEVAAYQWETTNRMVLDDLAALAPERWTIACYADLLAAPEQLVRRLSAFAGIEFDQALQQRCSNPLPRSRYTLTPPQEGKWRSDEAAILRVLPMIEFTWNRLKVTG